MSHQDIQEEVDTFMFRVGGLDTAHSDKTLMLAMDQMAVCAEKCAACGDWWDVTKYIYSSRQL